MPTLADIYSSIDTAKRRLSDIVTNPMTSAQQMLGYANDRAREHNALMDQQVADVQAARNPLYRGQAGQQLMQSVIDAYNPMGMTTLNKPFDYRSTHLAPGPHFGAPLHDLTGGGQMYPSDVYSASAARIYGTGFPQADKEAFALAKRVRGNPDAEVVMYRAVPKDVNEINKGDWVTLSKSYAKSHGESVLNNDYKILSKKVKAKDLYTNADSIHEFGYHPND